MFPLSKQRVVCLYLFSWFLYVSSFAHGPDSLLVSWPSIPAGEIIIKIFNCPNFESVPENASGSRPALVNVWLYKNAISLISGSWIQNSFNIENIKLHSNKLTSIPAFNCGVPGSEGCPELKIIWLQQNLIQSVPARSFANLPKLLDLRLDSNKIIALASSWIVDCPSVRKIWVYKNANLARFFVSDDLESRGLANLLELDFDLCNISSLDPNFLLLFPKLQTLYIIGNPIKTLPKFVAPHPAKIFVASMGNFVCDCSTTKLAHNGMIVSANEAGFCGSPHYNVGQSFSQLECKVTPEVQSRCDVVIGAQRASMGLGVTVPSGESDVFLSSGSSKCSAVSVRMLVSGSPDSRARYSLCPLEALLSTGCRFRCSLKCPRATCPVFAK